MDKTLDMLMTLTKKARITPSEARDGITYCFCVVNRAYMQNGAMEIKEDTSEALIDKMMHLLVLEVCKTINLDYKQPTVEGLKKLRDELDQRLRFSSKDPVILRKHNEVIDTLLKLTS